jgi:hypothetical protein
MELQKWNLESNRICFFRHHPEFPDAQLAFLFGLKNLPNLNIRRVPFLTFVQRNAPKLRSIGSKSELMDVQFWNQNEILRVWMLYPFPVFFFGPGLRWL